MSRILKKSHWTLLVGALALGAACQKEKKKKIYITTPAPVPENAPQPGVQAPVDANLVNDPSKVTVEIKDADSLSDRVVDGQLSLSFEVTTEDGSDESQFEFLCSLTDITVTATAETAEPKPEPCSKGSGGHKITDLEANRSFMFTVAVRSLATGEVAIAADAFFDTGSATLPSANEMGDIWMTVGGTYDVMLPPSMRITAYTSTTNIDVVNGLINLRELDDESRWSWTCHDFGREPFRPSQTHGTTSFPDYENGANPACYKRVTQAELKDITKGMLARNQLTMESTPSSQAADGRYETLIVRQYQSVYEFNDSRDFYNALCRIELDGTLPGYPNAFIPGRYRSKDAEFRSCIGGYLDEAGDDVMINQLLSSDLKTEVIYIVNDYNLTKKRAFERMVELLEHR